MPVTGEIKICEILSLILDYGGNLIIRVEGKILLWGVLDRNKFSYEGQAKSDLSKVIHFILVSHYKLKTVTWPNKPACNVTGIYQLSSFTWFSTVFIVLLTRKTIFMLFYCAKLCTTQRHHYYFHLIVGGPSVHGNLEMVRNLILEFKALKRWYLYTLVHLVFYFVLEQVVCMPSIDSRWFLHSSVPLVFMC